jgi:ABC-2 type transport system permease protein
MAAITTPATGPAGTTLLAPPAPTGLARVRWAARDGWLIAMRDMTQWVREPSMIVWGLAFPIVSVLLFAYVFGSGIVVPGGGNYREFLMPGIFAQTMAFGIGETLAAVQADSAKGVTDRFRSMPMAPSAVVIGRCVANMTYSALSLALMVACGLAIGWRWEHSVPEAAAAFGLLLLLRLAFMWVGIYLGLKAKTPEMANSIFGLLYPVTMLSNAFIASELMPNWLGTVVDLNPLSSTITATRSLFGNPGVEQSGWFADNAILLAVLWPLAITVLTLPLAVRAYQRLSR